MRTAADHRFCGSRQDRQSMDAPTREKIMRQKLHAGTLALALFGSGGFAAAQNAPASTGGQEKLNLGQSQERAGTQGLPNEPSQSIPGHQGQAGSQPPQSPTQRQ